MRNMMVIVLVGLSSAVAFADNGIPAEITGGKREKIEFSCRFEGCRPGDFKNPDEGRVECWVEGSICNDHKDKRCKDGDNQIEIKCSNGFELRSKDLATSRSDHTLWLNADADRRENDDRKTATLRVEDFFGETSVLNEFERQTVLVTAEERREIRDQLGDATRLEGRCRFKIKHED